jgi:hypothetical protein
MMGKRRGDDGRERSRWPQFGRPGVDTERQSLDRIADTLDALLAEQRRTNEFLERLVAARAPDA